MCGLDAALNGGKVYAPIVSVNGYGGAAFGGKTEGLVAIGLILGMMVPGVKVGYFRRTFPELEGSDGPIDRSRSLYAQAGAKYNASKHVWTFPKIGKGLSQSDEDFANSDSPMVRFCHAQYDKDKHAYQSQAFDVLLVDEATNFPWGIIDYLLTRNRVSKYSMIPKPFSIFTANPGGIGHMWYRKLFGIYGELYHANS